MGRISNYGVWDSVCFRQVIQMMWCTGGVTNVGRSTRRNTKTWKGELACLLLSVNYQYLDGIRAESSVHKPFYAVMTFQ